MKSKESLRCMESIDSLVFKLSLRHYHLTRSNRWSDCIGYRIEIVCQIGTLSTTLQHCIHTMKSSDPLLLADVTLRFGMYPAGKVAISRHLATPGFPQVDHTVGKLSADSGSLCSEV